MISTHELYDWSLLSGTDLLDLQEDDNLQRNWTLICAPIMADTVDEMLELIRKAKEQGADLVELRLDYLKVMLNNPNDHNLPLLLEQSCLPALVACRPTWEGGKYTGDESMRQNILIKAMELGADYIDIELKVADEFIESISERDDQYEKTKIIVSYHNYQSTPSAEDLGGLVARIQATGADLVKIVTTALDITDCAPLLQVFAHSQVPVIGVAMGEKGLISRILSAKFGGFLTFASIDGSADIASGEPTITDLINLYNFRCIGADTKVHGVLGNPIAHSKSPHLYNAAFNSVGFNGVYLPLLVDSVPKFLNTFSSPDFVGYSFTIPHKLAGLECCDEVDPIAKEIGAISCMIKRPWDGKLIGYNIDYLGAVAAIEAGLRGSNGRCPVSGSPLTGRLLVIIGAGGAGKALAYCGASNGARVVICDCVPEKAMELASKVGGEAICLSELNDFAPEDGMILANATPIGMQPNINDMPIATKALKHYSLVFDAIYTPKLTKLLKEAQNAGATIVFGSEMFINQAFIQFEKFTGLPGQITGSLLSLSTQILNAPKELMRQVLAKST